MLEALQNVNMPEGLDGFLVNIRENLPADLLEEGVHMGRCELALQIQHLIVNELQGLLREDF